jgi:hypothetical protein
MSGNRPPALSADEAKRKILWLLEEGYVEFTWHCRNESMPTRGITALDVTHALENGEVVGSPEWDDVHGNWKYRVKGEDLDGDDLTSLTVIIEEDATLRIITVF